MGIFQKMFDGLSKTRNMLAESVDTALSAFVKLDEDMLEELEDALIMADMGTAAAARVIGAVRERAKKERAEDAGAVKELIAQEIAAILGGDSGGFELTPPSVVLVVGVNGVGKTTSIGKLAHRFKQEGKSVILAAGDTFRAAAVDQLEIWAKRNDVAIIKQSEGSDPGAVIFDAVAAAKARRADVLICDTAGRLHNKKNLMNELGKLAKIIASNYQEAHVETLLVLEATTGQNALAQAKMFKEAANVSGIVLTKLDGTAKGGIVVAIKQELGLPVRFVGVGESIEDLEPFVAQDFAKALFDTKTSPSLELQS